MSSDGYAPATAEGPAPGTIDFALTPESVIPGRVVIAGTGEPAAEIIIVANSVEWGWVKGNTSWSRSDGRFEITGLRPGRYGLHAYDRQFEGAPPESVAVGALERAREVVIEMHPRIPDRQKSDGPVVRGRVVIDKTGAPCKEGTVAFKGEGYRTASINGEGQIELQVTPGEYEVAVTCRGAISEETYPRLTVADRDLDGLEWRVRAASLVTIRGTVVDRSGDPISQVMILSRRANEGRSEQAMTESDEDGQFEIKGCIPGVYSVTASINYVQTASLSVTLAANMETESIRFIFERQARIRGLVVDERGAPVAGVNAQFFRHHGEQISWDVSNDAGEINIRNLKPGRYSFQFSQSLVGPIDARVQRDGRWMQSGLDLAPGELAEIGVTVALSAADGEIRGTVIDAKAIPIEGAVVALIEENFWISPDDFASSRLLSPSTEGNSWGRTNALGAFKLIGLPPGAYLLRATRPGRGETIRRGVATGSEVTVEISEGGTLSGAVIFAELGPPSSFEITASNATGYARSERFLHTHGEWALHELPEGDYELTAKGRQGAGRSSAKVSAGEEKSGIAIQLRANGALRGVVVEQDTNQPIHDIMVSASAENGPEQVAWGHGRSDTNGIYRIDGVPAGALKISVDSVFVGFGAVDEFWVLAAPGRLTEVPPIRIARRKPPP